MTFPEPSTAAGRAGLEALCADPQRALIALDYDGTLAPITLRPAEAIPQRGVVEVLRTLAGQIGQLALVTGRPAEVVVALAGLQNIAGLVVLGQYGAQTWTAGRLTEVPPVEGLAEASRELAQLVADEGADVEDKRLSLVVHTRRAPDPGGSLVRLYDRVAALADRTGLEVHAGRLVLELRPPGHDKGLALRSLAHQRSAVLYAGDDVGDLAAYAEVTVLRRAGTPGLLVYSDSDEGPAALRSGADLVVTGPPGVVSLLEALAARLA